MLNFPETYFEREIRNDFTIEPMMKRCWAAQMEILQKIEEVCKALNISFYADWGTLLGTVRHHGFVPWDDDMDICMKRPDYNKFLMHAKEYLPKDYLLLHVSTSSEVTNMLCRVTNGNAIRIDDETLRRFHGFPYVAGVDIFPIDYIPMDKEAEQFQKDVVKIINETMNLFNSEEYRESPEILTFLDVIEEMCGVTLDRNGDISNQLLQLLDRVISLFREEESEYLASMCDYLNGWNVHGLEYKIPKEYYDEVIMMPFETIMLPVPKGFDHILKVKYGDYMTPVYNGTNHMYPFYQEQEALLKEYLKQHNISGDRFYL